MIPVHCAHTRLADPNTLEPNPANPNRHSAHQIQLLASIIEDQGWRNPVTVSKRSGLIVRGHGRLEAALLLGCETIPVDEQDYASEAEELADLLADNRLSELAELDEDDLRRVLKSIGETDPDFDLELTGFMEDEIRKLMEDDEDPADDLETIPRMECQAFAISDCGSRIAEWDYASPLARAVRIEETVIARISSPSAIRLPIRPPSTIPSSTRSSIQYSDSSLSSSTIPILAMKSARDRAPAAAR